MIDRDICAAANLMVKRHGDEALLQAAKRAEEWLPVVTSKATLFGTASSPP